MGNTFDRHNHDTVVLTTVQAGTAVAPAAARRLLLLRPSRQPRSEFYRERTAGALKCICRMHSSPPVVRNDRQRMICT